MTALATPPKLQFLDANGAPLVGGKLYTYAAGTTTPQASYTDFGGGTANANPVILDSRGEASVWLGTALYKMALYSATNVLIWTVDNIGGFATLAQLAASGGSNLVGFLQAGTGAVATTVQSKLRESVSVFDFMTAAQIADVQAGTALVDVTAALNVAVNSFPKVGIYTTNMSLLFPKGTYRISGPINFPTGIVAYPVITFEGRIFQTSATADCLVFDQVFYGKISGIDCDTTWDSWLNDRSAVKFNTLANTNLGISWATNFRKGLHLNAGPGATAYNEIHLSYMRNCKYGVYGTPDGTEPNFINANTFYGGNFENSYKATVSGDVGIYIHGPNYGNSFYDPIFESIHTAFDLTDAIGFLVSKPYFETTDIMADLTSASSGTWIVGHQTYAPEKFITNSQTRRLTFLNTGTAADNASATMEVDSSGIRWKRYISGDSSNKPSLTLSYEPYYGLNCLMLDDHVGGAQRFNKSYQTATGAPPTTGVFTAGAICWNATGTIGQPSGWVCYQLGTAGALVGVTGSVTIGTPNVVVNSAANLKPGMYINIAGAYAAGQIDYINGTTVTMTGNASATVAGAAVTYFAPLWRALANFA